jgi:outer membrane murein-binding lipoprotein Lpp
MKRSAMILAVCGVLVFGCTNKDKEEELRQQVSQNQSQKTALEQGIADRDAYFDDVMRGINQVYADLEKSRSKEATLKGEAGVNEGTAHFTNAEARQKLMQNISDIGAGLKANRKQIADLQAKVKSMNGKMEGLNTLIENLKVSIQEREESIAKLEARVQGLETTVIEKTRVIAEKEVTIETQQKVMNTAFYVVGTRDELKKKGIINDEGGFLWGLLGSTTIMASGIDGSQFTPIDKLRDQKIQVAGKIDEILPRRNADFFATARQEEGSSELTIVRPDKFWQDRYLVIVVD